MPITRVPLSVVLVLGAAVAGAAGDADARLRLPGGAAFALWEDRTAYRATYHVAQAHAQADDAGPGSAERPWRTIARAAAALQPGERVLVHAGVYRECVRPARGGESAERMIAYEAAPGETVVITASEPWPGPFEDLRARHGRRQREGAPRVWTGELPLAAFPPGYNPFALPVMSLAGWFPLHRRPPAEIRRLFLRRGQVFADGVPLVQRQQANDLRDGPGFAVEDPALRLALRLPEDRAPSAAAIEVAVREQCFAPALPGLGWIKVSGFTLVHAANGIPGPQAGALSTTGGHHWIIAGNTVRAATCVGIDIGLQQRWGRQGRPLGGHIVRGNLVVDCGICGLCGNGGVDDSLIEDNRFERIGGLDLEHCYEAAAIKLHGAQRVLIRGNCIRTLKAACGIWLDYACGGNRVDGNAIADVETLLAGIYIEANRHPNLVSGNVIAGIRDAPGNDPPKDGFPGGNGISVDISEDTVVAHNLVVDCAHAGIAVHLAQKERAVEGGSATGLGNHVFDNVVAGTPRRLWFARIAGNASDGNLLAKEGAAQSLCAEEPARVARYDLRGWRAATGFDRDSEELAITAAVAPATMTLRLACAAPAAENDQRRAPRAQWGYPSAGPFDAAAWAALKAGGEATVALTPAAQRFGQAPAAAPPR